MFLLCNGGMVSLRVRMFTGLSAAVILWLAALSVNPVHAQRMDQPLSDALDPFRRPEWYAQGVARPPGERSWPLSRWRRRLTLDGVAAFVTGYGFSAASAAVVSMTDQHDCQYEFQRVCDRSKRLFIPVVGPIIIGNDQLSPAIRICLASTQIAGLGMTLAGILLYAYAPTPDAPPSTAHWHWTAAPLAGGAIVSTSTRF